MNNNMRKIPYKTTTFYTGKENFMIDIVEKTETFKDGSCEKMYDSWLYRADMGIKEYIAGELKKNYKGYTVEQYAAHILDYCLIVWDPEKGYNSFDWYDEDHY